ncbi:MAG: helix-turn-helix domain-containing protein [Solirubrobacterales bacterium]|nr:helix-turn-helix domain-containing protein [Solirubrobacterales bacterium]
MAFEDPSKLSFYDWQARPASVDLVEAVARRAAAILADEKEEKEFLTTKEAAEIIPCSVSKVHHLVQCRRIPFQKVGNQLSFKRSEILDWKARGGATTPASASKVRS